MIEPFFGSSASMWTAVPPLAFAFQPPMALAATPGAPPLFSTTNAGVAPGAPQLGAGPLPGAPFGYGGMVGIAPQLPSMLGVTASSLVAAIAMRRGQPHGPTTDQELEEFLFEALDLLPGAGDVEVRSEGGRVTLTGTVQHRRVKRDIGEIAWAIPGVQDVQNTISIASRRRTRNVGVREGETVQSGPSRKQ